MNPYRTSWKPLESTPMDSTRKWSKHYLLLTALATLLIGLTFSFGGMIGEESAKRKLRPFLKTGPQACTDELHLVSQGISAKCGSPEQNGSLEVREGKVFLHCRCGRSAVFSCGSSAQAAGNCTTDSRAPNM